MEDWQKKHIIKNLPELINSTEFNSLVKAELLANNILSQNAVEELDADSDRKGKTAASYNYYTCLMTRVDAYIVLTKALDNNKQSGAVRILIDGLRSFAIPKVLDDFKNMKIEANGKVFKIHEFFSNGKLKLVQELFQKHMSTVELYEMFTTKQNTFVLATSTLPPEPPIYIPRFLSNRIQINQSIFQDDFTDVFVFRNNIERHTLSQIAAPHFTASSGSQLVHMTCRFIYLDVYEDWIDLKKMAKVPIHLISYDAEQKTYILQDTSASINIISKVGSKKEDTYISEDKFAQQQLRADLKESNVCICDSPGMGKTYLLANIARSITKECTGTIVAFVQLTTFVADFPLSLENARLDQEAVLADLFKYVSPSTKQTTLLVELVKAELLRLEIFFDGFDEIPLNKVECTKQVFFLIKDDLSNVRIYITSRPHMRHELEKSLGVIAYDILPFNFQNQVDYLVQVWSPNVPEHDKVQLEKYALRCLNEVNQTLTKNEKEMAGIPLLCHLIAEVYSNKVQLYSTTKSRNEAFTLKIPQIYLQFIEQRIRKVTRTEEEINNTKLFHIWQALKLLFPTESFCNDKMFSSMKDKLFHGTIFKIGIIQSHSNEKLDFLHRTFAEYFAAEYFSKKLQQTTSWVENLFRKFTNQNDKTQQSLILIIFALKERHWFFKFSNDMFVHSVILSFVDFNLKENTISEETKNRVASFLASTSPEKFLSILRACFHQNLFSLFSLLKEALTKWNINPNKKHFTTANCFELLSFCIRESTTPMFYSCIQLFTIVLMLDVEKIAIYDKRNTLLHIAAKVANYEAVEYLLDRVSLQLPSVLEKCVTKTYDNQLEMVLRRKSIAHLILNKHPTLMKQATDILLAQEINLELIKLLVKLGANLTSVGEYGSNCAMVAAYYMSASDYHELVQFLLTDCKAEYLFQKNAKWSDPLPKLIHRNTLLPETLEILLNIPGNYINMKDVDGENLLFSAVKGNIMDNFQQLVSRGLDYHATGRENRSLLHAAADWGRLKMVSYLLSLNLDINSRDENNMTPLHHAVAREYQFPVMKLLVENGADVKAKNKQGKAALHLSAAEHFPKTGIIKYLIGKGAEVNDRDHDGNTPLHACKTEEIMECLIGMGADMNAENKKGQTPAQIKSWLWKPSNYN